MGGKDRLLRSSPVHKNLIVTNFKAQEVAVIKSRHLYCLHDGLILVISFSLIRKSSGTNEGWSLTYGTQLVLCIILEVLKKVASPLVLLKGQLDHFGLR